MSSNTFVIGFPDPAGTAVYLKQLKGSIVRRVLTLGGSVLC